MSEQKPKKKPKSKLDEARDAWKSLKMIFRSPTAAAGPAGLAAEKLKKGLKKAGIQK